MSGCFSARLKGVVCWLISLLEGRGGPRDTSTGSRAPATGSGTRRCGRPRATGRRSTLSSSPCVRAVFLRHASGRMYQLLSFRPPLDWTHCDQLSLYTRLVGSAAEVTREALALDSATEFHSKVRPDDGYIALTLDEAPCRKLVGLLRERLGEDVGAEDLFRALMLLSGPIGAPPFVWPKAAPTRDQHVSAGARSVSNSRTASPHNL